jgi:two-component system sensor histidine kinase KdpD
MQQDFPYAAAPELLARLSIDESTAPSRLSWRDRLLRIGANSSESGWRDVAASLAIVACITAAGVLIAPEVPGYNLAIFYMLAVVFCALRWGRRAVFVSAIAGAFLFDYFFVPPVRRFVVGDVWYLITLLGMLTVGLIISMLVVTAREEAAAARRREAHTRALYSLTNSLAVENQPDQVLDAIERQIIETFHRPLTIWLPGPGGLAVRFRSARLTLAERDAAAAAWVFENGRDAGYGTEHFSDSSLRLLPLKTWQGVVGVAGIQVRGWKEWPSRDRQHLLGTFMNQAALAITRVDLARKARRAELLQQTDKLQKALLNSVSHDLRTPLASVLGVLNTLLEDGALLDASTQQSLLATAQDEARRLDWLVRNLLDMTRLEGAAINVKIESCDVHDLVAAALYQLGDAARARAISVTMAPDLPLVPMDQPLIIQVLVNMLDNALKYSPAETPIEIDALQDGGYLELRVLDRGRGIPEAELEHVFDKFFRVAYAGSPKGAGLGLSICKGFVEAHHGHILAKPRPQGGTEVAFFLPLEAHSPAGADS